ncbi:hypothetical protein EVAR_33867_1 [Eumeta japonica]|uniref:Uncharacterized protein n=1 Tax=Eumeta variegata TaxID=151549 RepID=A0A4C1X8G0_EUMVA|nr:hypothetical protein EVAR_33867_1 [Eumeta japonica]
MKQANTLNKKMLIRGNRIPNGGGRVDRREPLGLSLTGRIKQRKLLLHICMLCEDARIQSGPVLASGFQSISFCCHYIYEILPNAGRRRDLPQ